MTTTNADVTRAAERIISHFDDTPFPHSAFGTITTIITEEVVGPMMVEQARLIGRRDGERDAAEARAPRERDELIEALREQVKHCTGCSGTGISNVLTHPNCADKQCDRCKEARTILARFPVTPELEHG